MSTEQIHQILKRLDEQDKKAQERVDEQHKTYLIIRNDIANLQNDLKPIHEVFESVTGFNSIAVWILKALILLGAGIGVVFGFISWLKK